MVRQQIFLVDVREGKIYAVDVDDAEFLPQTENSKFLSIHFVLILDHILCFYRFWLY